MPLKSQLTNLRDTQEFLVCLQYTTGTYTGSFSTDCKVVRNSAGNYTINLGARYRRLLGGDVTNGLITTAPFLNDATLTSAGTVVLTFTEPADTRSVFVRMTVSTADYNAKSPP